MVGVAAFLGSLRGLKLVPSKQCCLVPPRGIERVEITSGYPGKLRRGRPPAVGHLPENMKVINNRTELQSLINENFNYLITKAFQIVEVNISSDNKSWVVVLDGNIKSEGSRVNAKSSNSGGACL